MRRTFLQFLGNWISEISGNNFKCCEEIEFKDLCSKSTHITSTSHLKDKV